MKGYLRAVLRHRVARELSLTVLAVGGVAAGSGSLVAVHVLVSGAMSAFDASVDLVSGRADAVILGRGGKLDESLYPSVLAVRGIAYSEPVLEATVVLPDSGTAPGRLPLYGLDLLSATDVPLLSAGSARLDDFLASPAAAITDDLARELGIGLGDSLRVASRGPPAFVRVFRILDQADRAPGSGPMLVMDIAAAQRLVGSPGWITRINVGFRSGYAPEEVHGRLAAALEGRALLSTPDEQRAEARQLISAFRVNLSALALVSAFVGVFLVYGTMRASLMRRRKEMGVLRSLGATRGQILRSVLAEAAALGAVGSGLGVALGYGAALANLDSVSGTVTDLYLLSAIRTLELPATIWVLALAGGVIGTVAGAAGPAAEVCMAPVSDLLSEKPLRARWRGIATWMWRGSMALLAALLLWYFAIGQPWQHAGFILAAGLMACAAMASPIVVASVCGRLRVQRFGWPFALRSLTLRLHTSAVAVAGVGIAFGVLVGITVMVGSFRDTFRAWLNDTMRADIYLSSATWSGASDQGSIVPSLTSQIAELPSVATIDPLRGFHGTADGLPVWIQGVEFGRAAPPERYAFLSGDPLEIAAAVRGGGVIVSEPLARHSGLWTGDSLTVETESGPVRARIAGVYYQYGSARGSLSMDLATMETWYGPGGPHALAVYLQSTSGSLGASELGMNADFAMERIRQIAAPYPVLVRSNHTLHDTALGIFDQTFAVTLLLQGMALVVAGAGVALSLLIMAHEEARETGVYRALGATRGQLFRYFLGKGVGLAGLGGILGIASGAGLAVTLIYVINRAYFGWTVQLNVPVANLLQQGATLMLTAAAASWLPALWASAGGAQARGES